MIALKEAIQMRKKLEAQIFKLIKDFELETGLEVASIERRVKIDMSTIENIKTDKVIVEVLL